MPTTRSAAANDITITKPPSRQSTQVGGGMSMRQSLADAPQESEALAGANSPIMAEITEEELRVRKEQLNDDMAAFGVAPEVASKRFSDVKLFAPERILEHGGADTTTQPKIHEAWQKARPIRYGETVRLTWDVISPDDLDDDREIVLVHESNERGTPMPPTPFDLAHLRRNNEFNTISAFSRKRRASTSLEGSTSKRLALNATPVPTANQ